MPSALKVGRRWLAACGCSTLVALLFAGGCSPTTTDKAKPSTEAIHDRSSAKLVRITGSDSDSQVSTHDELTYDAAGTHLVRQTFFIGASGPSSTIDYTYEGDRITRDVFTRLTPDGPQTITTKSYEYDGERLSRITVEQGGVTATIQYDYDDAGALVAIENGTARDSYTYDDAGRLKAIDGPSGHYEFTYDGKGRLATLADGPGDHYEFTYNDSGRVDVITSVEGRRHSFTYDEQGRLSTLTMQLFGPSVAPRVFQYTYADGSLTNMSLRTGIDGNEEVRNFVDLEGHTFGLPDPRQLEPNL